MSVIILRRSMPKADVEAIERALDDPHLRDFVRVMGQEHSLHAQQFKERVMTHIKDNMDDMTDG